MRWICKDDVDACLTEQWRQAAAHALDRLQHADTPKKRQGILRTAASTKIWRDFYDLLPDTLKQKCWYCEAEEIRSDMPVDHFRPKNEVEEDSAHLGYWWLAYDWSNYRCACTFCNSRRVMESTDGGKQCHFPLVDPSKRAYQQTDKISNEEPDLLDPFNSNDEKLLWFDNDGKPVPSPVANAAQQQKVSNSIKIFHLDEQRIVRQRNSIRLLVKQLVDDLKTAITDGRPAEVQTKKDSLKKMVRNTEKLSRAAVVYLRAHRDMPEVCDILQID
jgi:uncharacterized protein (TIGR02646 family)